MTRTQVMFGAAIGALALGLGACSQATNTAASATSATQCVDVPDGYYVYENGQFTPVSAPSTTVVEKIIEVDAPKGVADRIGATFAGLGFPWMDLNVRGEVATLIGLAPNAEAKARAFAAGEAAIKGDADASRQIRVIVDGISVEGGEAAVGAALADLGDKPKIAECRKAFVDTMDGRFIDFERGSATISQASARLLDATTGVALLCKDYTIEVRGHTDVTGDANYNLNLSQQRADAVRGYLINSGVDATTLTAVGFGETRPLDTAMTPEAHAKNRRTEFIVRTR